MAASKPLSLSSATVNWRWAHAICLYRDWIRSHCSCWPSTSPEKCSGWRSGVRHSLLWETGRTGFQIVRYFQEKILLAQFLHLLVPRKTLKSFVVNLLLMTSSNLLQNVCLVAWAYPFANITYVYEHSPLPLWSCISELSELLPPRLQSSFFPK